MPSINLQKKMKPRMGQENKTSDPFREDFFIPFLGNP